MLSTMQKLRRVKDKPEKMTVGQYLRAMDENRNICITGSKCIYAVGTLDTLGACIGIKENGLADIAKKIIKVVINKDEPTKTLYIVVE
jgi:hypothetical protein